MTTLTNVNLCGALQLGDLPTWLGFISAATAAVIAYRVFRIEQARDLQATQVSGWYGLAVVKPELPGNREFWRATVRNASNLPVYDLEVEFYQANAPASDPPFDRQERTILPPGTEQFETGMQDRDLLIALKFRDAAGVVWYRNVHGVLKKRGRANLPK